MLEQPASQISTEVSYCGLYQEMPSRSDYLWDTFQIIAYGL